MPTSYMPYEPTQDFLLPPSLQEWLPQDHLAHFICDTVDQMDLEAFYARYEGGGSRNQPFHPAMMVKVLVYAYASGVFSSRKIAKKLHEDVAFRVLSAGNFPKHRTICDFRALHLQELSTLFVQVVKLARECGLVKMGTIAVDGTKLRANASKHKAMSYERMQAADKQLQQQVKELLDRAARTDAAEADEPQTDIPAEIARREKRVQAIREAKQRLEQRQREADEKRGRTPDDDNRPKGNDGQPKKSGRGYAREFGVPEPKAQDNFTDPDSRIMKTSAGFEQCYNAQTAVDAHAQLIVAAELTNVAADNGELPRMLQAATDNTGKAPELGLADAGYRSEEVLEQLSNSSTEVLIALGREGNQQVEIDAAKLPLTAAMAAKLQSAEGQAKYRRRKAIVEPPNAWIKRVLGFRQFSFRGVDKVRCEFKLVCAALNLRRMATMMR
jgi:transposase